MRRNSFSSSVLESKRPIYCASRLYTPLDRIGGCNLADAVEATLIAQNMSSSLNARECVFLPFRDTNQAAIEGADRAQKIYRLDIDVLKGSSALFARLEGIAPDSGVSMEIGFAFGLGIPIAVIATDFIWEGFEGHKTSWNFNPIIEEMATLTFRSYVVGDSQISYRDNNLSLELTSLSEFVNEAFAKFPTKSRIFPKSDLPAESVYIDMMGGRFDWSQRNQLELGESLDKLKIGFNFPRRYRDTDAMRVTENAHHDVTSAASASVAVFSADGLEIDSGSAALFGLCKSIGVPTVLYYSSGIVIKGAGAQKMRINLMIDQAADEIATSIPDTLLKVRKFLRG